MNGGTKTISQGKKWSFLATNLKIAHFPNNIFSSDPHLKHEFINLVSQHCTFVSDRESELISLYTIWLNTRKVPAKEAMKQFVSIVC